VVGRCRAVLLAIELLSNGIFLLIVALGLRKV
jgi:hypothetical protein